MPFKQNSFSLCMSGTLALLRLHILLPCHDIHFKDQNFEVIFRLGSEIHWLTTKHKNVTLNPKKILGVFRIYLIIIYFCETSKKSKNRGFKGARKLTTRKLLAGKFTSLINVWEKAGADGAVKGEITIPHSDPFEIIVLQL